MTDLTKGATTTTHRRLSGKVVSDKMQKTVTVSVDRRVKHPTYGKIMTRTSKIHARNDLADVKAGDWVTIEETRPLAKTVAWKVVSLDRKSAGKLEAAV